MYQQVGDYARALACAPLRFYLQPVLPCTSTCRPCHPTLTPIPGRRYWLRFALLGSIEVPLYAWHRGRRACALRAAASIAAYWLAVGWLWRCNAVATLYTLVLPYALSSLLLMFGNW